MYSIELDTHAGFSSVVDVLGERLVGETLSENGQLLVRKCAPVADQMNDAAVELLVGHEARELREVVRVPLAHSHRERVHVLVELVEQRDRLDDHVVDTVHVELDLTARVRVRQRALCVRGELGGRKRAAAGREALDELLSVQAQASDDLGHDARLGDRNAQLLGDARGQL